MADARFRRGALASLYLHPIVLNKEIPGDQICERTGLPSLAEGSAARSILERVAGLSRKLGTNVNVADTYGQVEM